MKGVKKRLFKHKIISGVLVGLFILLIIILLIIRFSPPILITLPLGESFVQIAINKGFNAFFPKDKNSLYYFHNSITPQTITGANTSYKGKESMPYFQIHLPHFPNIPVPNYSLKLPTSEITKYVQSIPSVPLTKINSITSQEINLTFTVPDDYRIEYKPKTQFNNIETININYGSTGNPEWMSIQISDWQKCEDKPLDSHTPYAFASRKTITVAGKWPLTMTKSHPRYGSQDQVGDACLDENITLDMTRYVRDNEGEVEKAFDKILETAVFKP